MLRLNELKLAAKVEERKLLAVDYRVPANQSCLEQRRR